MINAVKTHIISGFLGAGKSSAIQHLLSQRPEHEVWAILVNEFGEIGIDQALLAGGSTPSKQVVIQEIPGGCMCCAAGVPMRVALNKLLKAAQPDRLLIEPTGLGHPQQVLKSLQSAQYQGVLEMQGVITLVDARLLDDPRYAEHDIFKQQLAVADLVIANKADLYQSDELETLQRYLQGVAPYKARLVRPLKQAKLPFNWLTECTVPLASIPHFTLFKPASQVEAEITLGTTAKQIGAQYYTQQQDTFVSCGWIFAANACFERDKLLQLLAGLEVVRLKAVLMTDQGALAINQVNQECSLTELAAVDDSRIEFISLQALPKSGLFEQLTQCLVPTT